MAPPLPPKPQELPKPRTREKRVQASSEPSQKTEPGPEAHLHLSHVTHAAFRRLPVEVLSILFVAPAREWRRLRQEGRGLVASMRTRGGGAELRRWTEAAAAGNGWGRGGGE